MARNPVIENLVKSAVDRCRERITSGRKSGRAPPDGSLDREESGITDSRKHSHGL